MAFEQPFVKLLSAWMTIPILSPTLPPWTPRNPGAGALAPRLAASGLAFGGRHDLLFSCLHRRYVKLRSLPLAQSFLPTTHCFSRNLRYRNRFVSPQLHEVGNDRVPIDPSERHGDLATNHVIFCAQRGGEHVDCGRFSDPAERIRCVGFRQVVRGPVDEHGAQRGNAVFDRKLAEDADQPMQNRFSRLPADTRSSATGENI